MGSSKQVAIELWTSEHPAGQRHNASVACQAIAALQRRAEDRLQVVDRRQDRIGKFINHAAERASPRAHIAPGYALVLCLGVR